MWDFLDALSSDSTPSSLPSPSYIPGSGLPCLAVHCPLCPHSLPATPTSPWAREQVPCLSSPGFKGAAEGASLALGSRPRPQGLPSPRDLPYCWVLSCSAALLSLNPGLASDGQPELPGPLLYPRFAPSAQLVAFLPPLFPGLPFPPRGLLALRF